MMTKPERSYIAPWTHNRTWNTIRNNSRIQERKQEQEQQRWWRQKQLREQTKKKEEAEGRRGAEGGGQLQASHCQSEVVFMFAVDSERKVLIAGLRETVLLVQNVQDSHQLGFHQIWNQQFSVHEVKMHVQVPIYTVKDQYDMMSDALEITDIQSQEEL